MAFIPWVNGIQLCFDMTTGGQLWQFCLALRKSSGAPTTQDLQDVADLAHTWWTGTLAGSLENGTTLRQTRATDMTVQGGPVRFNTTGGVGGVNGLMLPLSTALVVSGRTAKRGRSFRGRTYVGGFGQASLISEVDFSSALASTLASNFGGLQTGLDAIGFDMVVASQQFNGVKRATAELNEIVAWIVDQHVDNQRRRLAGRGT